MSQLEDFLLGKMAETVGTSVMPVGAPTYSDRKTSLTQTIKKVGGMATFEDLHRELELGQPVSGEMMQRAPQAAPVKTRVDVSGKDAPTVAEKKEAQYYALPSFSRYPLDSYDHVKQASAYFDEYYEFMIPEHRREYSQNLCKRASALGIEVGLIARKYGSDTYAPDGDFNAALMGRESLLKEAAHVQAFTALREHRALMRPEDFAVALGEFDKVAGIDEHYDSHVLDPYYTTFGVKLAEDDDQAQAILVGNDYISVTDLKKFARTCSSKLHDMFGEDFVKEFRKDPVSITRSLPVDQKKAIIRLASSTLTDPTTT